MLDKQFLKGERGINQTISIKYHVFTLATGCPFLLHSIPEITSLLRDTDPQSTQGPPNMGPGLVRQAHSCLNLESGQFPALPQGRVSQHGTPQVSQEMDGVPQPSCQSAVHSRTDMLWGLLPEAGSG